jgi:rare lipoprotein A
VTNPATGRSVIVRINDRGPYVRGRGLDLAKGAAEAIGMIGQGTAMLSVARLN